MDNKKKLNSDDGLVFSDPSILPSKQKGDRLEPGFRLHDFVAKSLSGSILQLSDFTTKRIWMAFYRYAGCPMCAIHFDEVVNNLKILQQNNVAFLAFFDSSGSGVSERQKAAQGKNVFVITNEHLAVYDDFGVESSWFKLFSPGSLINRVKAGAKGYIERNLDGSLNRIPAHILAETGGEVVIAHYGKDAGDHVSWKDALQFIQSPAKRADFELSLDADPK